MTGVAEALSGKLALVTGGSRGIGANRLYRIATNVCLTALESRVRRLLPSGPGDPARVTEETLWLQPIPDAPGQDPAAGADREPAVPAAPQAKAILDRYIAAFRTPTRRHWNGRCAMRPCWSCRRPRSGSPAAAAYRLVDGEYHAYGIVLPTTTSTHLTKIIAFADPSLFATFGLPVVQRRCETDSILCQRLNIVLRAR